MSKRAMQVKTVTRFDRAPGEIKTVKRYDYEPTVNARTETTREGFLKVMARATRTGVLTYRNPDGSTIRELRHPSEVFNGDSMESLTLKPITNDHPVTLLDSESASMHQVGSTGETVKVVDGKYLDVMTVITDGRTIRDTADKKIQVSPGYVCELEFTPGTYDGEDYDAIQRNIRYNHLAIVKKGRSGPEVCLKLDGEDAAIQDGLNPQSKGKKKMAKMKINGKSHEIDDDLADDLKEHIKGIKEENSNDDSAEEVAAAKKKVKAADAAKKDAEERADTAEARADGLEAEVKKLKTERKDAAPADVKALVRARTALIKTAEMAGVEKADEMDDEEIKKAVILKHDPAFKMDGRSPEYIQARFDVASESLGDSDDRAREVGKNLSQRKDETEVMDSSTARDKMIERQRKQWNKTPANAET